MDPISIVGAVAAAVQFIDFGARLFSTSFKVYRDGAGTGHADVELERISADLINISRLVTAKLESIQNSSGARTIAETTLLEECRRCEAMGEEIASLMNKIRKYGVERVSFRETLEDSSESLSRFKMGGSRLTKLRTALLLVWNQKQIDQMAEKLSQTKYRLLAAMISHMWDRVVSQDQKPPVTGQLLTRNESLIHDLNSGVFIKQPVLDEFIHPPTILCDPTNFEHRRYGVLAHHLLRNLMFDSIDSRVQAIPKAYERTCEWALQEPRCSEVDKERLMWSSLPDWLEKESDNVYWVTGKPGSGKSTLMKYLTTHPRTLEYLKNWSAGRHLLVATYYSWNAGSNLQKSQEGLLRTLLCRIIQQAPEIISQVCPVRLATLEIFGNMSAVKLPQWTWNELVEALLGLSSNHNFSLAIFVDGLDEFEGQHSALIELIKRFHNRPGIKVCVSSRPWNEFKDSFAFSPHLQMEKLTEYDMEIFVRGRFEANIAFADLRRECPSEAGDLLAGIVGKAMGVFLWVSLVTKALLTRISDGDDLIFAKSMLGDLPSDLADLYARLWGQIKPEYKEGGTRLLLLFHVYTMSPIWTPENRQIPRVIPAETLWAADDGIPMSKQQIVRTLQRRLNSRTMGLLEMMPFGQVGYLHRTAMDWIESFWPEIESQTPVNFDAHLSLFRAHAREASNLANLPVQNSTDLYLSHIWSRTVTCFYHASRIIDNPHNYDLLVTTMDDLEKSLRVFSSGNKPLQCDVPHWVSVEMKGLPHFGFAVLAAEYGVVVYVRGKVLSNVNYLMATEGADDLLAGLLLGPNQWHMPMLKTGFSQAHPDDARSSNSFFQRSDIFQSHVNFDHDARYNLADELLRRLATLTPERSASLHTAFVERCQHMQWKEEYFSAAAKLLERYSPKQSLLTRIYTKHSLMTRILHRSKKAEAQR